MNPFNPRFALSTRPFFPICASNLRRGHGLLLLRKRRPRKRNRGRNSRGVYNINNKGGSALAIASGPDENSALR